MPIRIPSIAPDGVNPISRAEPPAHARPRASRFSVVGSSSVNSIRRAGGSFASTRTFSPKRRGISSAPEPTRRTGVGAEPVPPSADSEVSLGDQCWRRSNKPGPGPPIVNVPCQGSETVGQNRCAQVAASEVGALKRRQPHGRVPERAVGRDRCRKSRRRPWPCVWAPTSTAPLRLARVRLAARRSRLARPARFRSVTEVGSAQVCVCEEATVQARPLELRAGTW